MTNSSSAPISNEIKSSTVAEFINANKFVEVNPTVAVNKNGYPFVTFIDEDNKAENIYFAKTIADSFPQGMAVGSGFFSNLQIVEVTNAQGETRIKLAKKGGNRLSLASIL